MIQTPPDPGQAVDGHVLVKTPWRQTFGQNTGGGDGSRRDQNMQIGTGAQHFRYQCERRLRFTNAGCMDPGKRAVWPWPRRNAVSFGKAVGVFLPAGETAVKKMNDQRCAYGGEAAIQGQAHHCVTVWPLRRT